MLVLSFPLRSDKLIHWPLSRVPVLHIETDEIWSWIIWMSHGHFFFFWSINFLLGFSKCYQPIVWTSCWISISCVSDTYFLWGWKQVGWSLCKQPSFPSFYCCWHCFWFFKFHICLVPVSGSSASLGVSTITAEYQHILN